MITIDYFSDALCVWAYGGQVRLDELRQQFGTQIFVRERFTPLFADTQTRIGTGWQDRGGFAGFGEHVREVCQRWPDAPVHQDIWLKCRPLTSSNAHQFIKAVELCLGATDGIELGARAVRMQLADLSRRIRRGFFRDGMDIGRLDVLMDFLNSEDPAPKAIREQLDNGAAAAALAQDIDLASQYGVRGSPTFVFNEGRQLLYGNVGYRIIEANLRELLDHPSRPGEPSWC